MARVVCIGEAMLELTRNGDGWRMGYGGDTLNTAIHLARSGHDVAYMTAIGADTLSAGLKQRWASEGLDVSLVLDHPGRNTGLYAIDTDLAGERSFSYWREFSAAREMFNLPGSAGACARAEEAELLCFSLISLAILPREGREQLLSLARSVRKRGGRVAFDGNYRPRLWSSPNEAGYTRDAAISVADIGLPTLEDEQLLSNGVVTESVADHWNELGCAETVIKLGARGCRLPDGVVLAPPTVLSPVDTSGAGDAFNAGYLAARLDGCGVTEAARSGHALASWTIMRPGAIPSRDS